MSWHFQVRRNEQQAALSWITPRPAKALYLLSRGRAQLSEQMMSDDERLKAAAQADGRDDFYRYVPFEEIDDRLQEGWRVVDDFEKTHHQFAAVVLMWLPADDETDTESADANETRSLEVDD